MTPSVVTRRFEVRAADARALGAVEETLSKATDKFPPAHLRTRTIRRSTQPDMVAVRLEGSAGATAAVRESVPPIDGVYVYRDWLDVSPPRPGESYVYPDERALARIDPYGLSRRETGTRDGKPVIVAVIDSGITVDHPKFTGHLWTDRIGGQVVHGARFMDGQSDYDVTDQDGHGTMLAGTILATANFAAGVEIMAVKFFDVTIQPHAVSAAAAIRFAVDHDASIINLSFDLGIGSLELQQAVLYAHRAGALVVAAAGNTGSNNDAYPLIPPHYAQEYRDSAIVVMATDWYDERPTFSNFGEKTVDLAAPGVRIVSTRAPLGGAASTGEVGLYTGTSPAAAQVSGAAALLKSKQPAWAAKDIKARLKDRVDSLPRLKCASRGRLNLGRALS